MAISYEPSHRTHVRGSVEAWSQLEKARTLLLATWKNAYVDHDVIVSICEDIATEQDRLIALRPLEDPKAHRKAGQA